MIKPVLHKNEKCLIIARPTTVQSKCSTYDYCDSLQHLTDNAFTQNIPVRTILMLLAFLCLILDLGSLQTFSLGISDLGPSMHGEALWTIFGYR